MIVTANELKTRGVASIDAALKEVDEVTISVRGRDKFVVMNVETYNRFRDYELEVALSQARRDISNGLGIEESVDDHLSRLKNSDS